MNSLATKLLSTAFMPVVLVLYIAFGVVMAVWDVTQAVCKDLVFIWTGRI